MDRGVEYQPKPEHDVNGSEKFKWTEILALVHAFEFWTKLQLTQIGWALKIVHQTVNV